jgi:hypothetical protein
MAIRTRLIRINPSQENQPFSRRANLEFIYEFYHNNRCYDFRHLLLKQSKGEKTGVCQSVWRSGWARPGKRIWYKNDGNHPKTSAGFQAYCLLEHKSCLTNAPPKFRFSGGDTPSAEPVISCCFFAALVETLKDYFATVRRGRSGQGS